MKTLIKTFLTLGIVFFTISTIKSQDVHQAPSLQVGLSGISFSQGNLDAALIAEIVAEKQNEVKTKLIKNMLLSQVGVDNGLFYAFIDQNIDILLTEKDESTRIKNLLENIVNLSFVVSYTEYYISTLKPNSAEWKNLKNLALSFGVDEELFDKTKLSLLDFTRINYQGNSSSGRLQIQNTPKEKIRNRFISVLIDLFSEVVRQNSELKSLGVLRTNYLQNYLSMNAYVNLKNEEDNEFIKPFVVKVDNQLSKTGFGNYISLMEKIQNGLQNNQPIELINNELKDATYYSELLMKSSNELTKAINKIPKEQEVFGNAYNENYRRAIGTSTFNDFIKSTYNIDINNLSQDGKKQWGILFWYLDAKFKQQFYSILLSKKVIADKVFDDAHYNLKIHMKYYGLIKTLASKGNDIDQVIMEIQNQFDCGNGDQFYSNAKNEFIKARSQITDISQLLDSEKKALENAGSFMDKLKYIELNRYEYMRSYENDIRPGLVNLSKYSYDFLEAGKNMEGFINCIQQQASDELKSININFNPAFINLFTKIDEFDKVDTYAHFINHMSDAGDIFSDENMRKSINKILTYVRSYLKVIENDKGELALNLDVEGFLLSLQKIPYNKYRPLGLHFTVGVNNSYFTKDLALADGSNLRNYSFVGEKIGIKFKIVDYKYLNSFSKGETFSYWGYEYVKVGPPREPTISNIHFLLYGSGILYNLVNTGTTQDFNSPIIATGFGISFFNDLDFNLSIGTPVVSNKPFFDSDLPLIFNVGFDIQFMEYLSRLQQKRNSNKIQKQIAKAKSAEK